MCILCILVKCQISCKWSHRALLTSLYFTYEVLIFHFQSVCLIFWMSDHNSWTRELIFYFQSENSRKSWVSKLVLYNLNSVYIFYYEIYICLTISEPRLNPNPGDEINFLWIFVKIIVYRSILGIYTKLYYIIVFRNLQLSIVNKIKRNRTA